MIAPSGPLTIEILDAAGKLVRRYASTDTAMPPQDVGNVPRWWIRPTRVPSAEPGMHRFVWDLHYPYPAVSEFSYPISATPYDTPREPRGPWALPGAYTVRLTVNGKSYTQPLTVRMDPRVKTPPAVLARLALSQRLVALIREDSAALAEVRAMQTRRRADSTTGRAAAPPTPDSLDRKLGTLVGEGAGQGPGAAPPPNLVQLQGDLLALYDAVQGSDAAPTTQLVAAVAEAERKMSALLAQWRGLRGR